MKRSAVLVRPLINTERNSPFFLPLGLLGIAAAARAGGHAIAILDFEFEHKVGIGFESSVDVETFATRIVRRTDQVIGITALADTLPTVLALGRSIKHMNSDACVVLGGPGMFGVMDALVQRFPSCFDFLCEGEGEGPFLELLNSDLRSPVPGMRAAHSIPKQPIATAALGVGSAPLPAYDLVDVPSYLELASPRIFDLRVGEGCTYKCSFCTTAPFWHHQFTARSPESIFSEMEYIHRLYGVTKFNFVHDNLANNRQYLNQLIDYFIAHNSQFSWGCAVRPDNVPLEIMKRMHTAGCRFVFCGTNSGDAAILRSMRKMTSNEKSYRFFRDAREAGLAFETNTIIGYPDENEEALESSMKIVFDAIAFGGSTADVSVLQPLPGASVTLQYIDQIEPVDDNGILTYLPAAARDLISQNRDVFTGFGFIRRGNKAFDYYVAIADRLRYFTRHFFRTAYFLKNRLGLKYRHLLEATFDEPLQDRYGERLCEFALSLGLERADRDVLRSVIEYDTALESVKRVDVVEELKNIYGRAPGSAESNFVVVTLSHEVHKIFATLPVLTSVPAERVTYVMRRDGGGVRTIRLRRWQHELWENIRQEPTPLDLRALLSRWGPHVARRAGVPLNEARSAISATLSLFDGSYCSSPRTEEVLQPEAS